MIGALVAIATGAEAATPQRLSEPDLRSAVTGKTVRIDTPLGMPLTVSYGANGIMTGAAGTALAMYLGSDKDRGRWHVRGGRLCQKWFKWLDAEETCMEVSQEGQRIFWRTAEGKTGTATIEPGPPVLAGATASGLGAPLPPSAPDLENKRSAAEVAAETASQMLVRQVSAKAAPAEVRPAEARKARPDVVAALPPPRPESAAPRPAAPVEPRLVEPLREIVRAAAASAWRPAPRPPTAAPQDEAVPAVTAARLSNPTAAEELSPAQSGSMREAGAAAVAWALEHRWCLPNALATAATRETGDSSVPAAGAVPSDPSLLAVSAEQLALDELPLYPPACLTVAPAIGEMARLASGLAADRAEFEPTPLGDRVADAAAD
jgi:hypothetical protein